MLPQGISATVTTTVSWAMGGWSPLSNPGDKTIALVSPRTTI